MVPNKVLIGGGNGFIGKILQQKLISYGYEPMIISRHSTPPDINSTTRRSTISWRDLSRNGLPSDLCAVINLAGRNIGEPFTKWNDELKRDIWNSRIDTTKLLAKIIAEHSSPPSVFISTSAVGIYPPSISTEYDEYSSIDEKANYFTRLCVAWEASATVVPIRSVILRLGVVLGRSGGIIGNTFWQYYFGLGGPIGSGEQWFPWIHVDDCVELMIRAIRNDQMKGVYNACAPQIIKNREFSNAFAGALGRPACFRTPEFVANIIFGSERASMLLLNGQKVYPKRTLSAGFQFRYPDIDSAAHEFAHL